MDLIAPTVGFLALGGLLCVGGWMLLREYRNVFLADPRAAMSVEVLLQILFHPAATAAFLGAMAIFFGFWFLALGLLFLLFPLFIKLWILIGAISTSLGLGAT